MGDLKDRFVGGISLSNIIAIATLLVVIGMWAGGLSSMERQLLVWLEDAEIERRNNHNQMLSLLHQQRKDINHMNVFLIRKYPIEYKSINSN